MAVPITPIVVPPSSMAALCAAVSIPSANPEMTVKPSRTSSLDSRFALNYPFSLASLEPTMEMPFEKSKFKFPKK